MKVSPVENDLCFIDIETTGSLFGYHEILDIAAIRTLADGKTVLEKTNTKLKPKFPDRITPVAQSITNFNNTSWLNSIEPDEIFWNSLKSFWLNCTPICHNPSFDRAFITLEMLKCGINDVGLDYHWIGTESLFWPWVARNKAKNNSLSTILRYFNLPAEQLPHIAMNGAKACRAAYVEIMYNFDILD